MRKTALSLAIAAIAALSAFAKPIAFKPDRAWFAPDGWTCLAQSVKPAEGGDAELELPPGVLLDSIRVSIEGKADPAWRFTETRAPDEKKKAPGAYLLSVSGIGKGDRAEVSYYCQGAFSSEALLEVELLSSTASWKAVLESQGGFGLGGCEAWLAADIGAVAKGGRAYTRPAASDIAYPLGRIDLPAKSASVRTIASSPVAIKHVYVLEPSARAEVQDRISFRNPFAFDLCPADCVVRKDRLVVGRVEAGYVARDGEVSASASIEPSIRASRSATTKQVGPSDQPLAFEHSIRYELRNLSGGDVDASIVFEKKFGNRDANEYVFDRPPDSATGDGYAWNQRVPKDGAMVVSFKIRSDRSRYSEYADYEEYYGGR